MRYESARTERGNVGVSYSSQAEADKQAAEMDAANCTNCRNCTDCINCTNCTNCINCRYCINCTDCTNCRSCRYCTNCTNCRSCANCANCTDCINCRSCANCKGVQLWEGEPVTGLLAFNGLRWPVAVSETQMQIGCQCHTIERWRGFTDAQIAAMDVQALEFWLAHRDFLLGICDYAAHRTGRSKS